ncbi:MAG: hypothetical protein WCT24_01970 [Patescibacteria group bacterium]|jgi:hypothetical protein
MNKLSFLLTGILLLGAGCAKAPVVTEHADWQTYSDATHGIILQYPSDAPVDIALTPLNLAEAIGGKERTLKVHNGVFAKTDLDANGCLNLTFTPTSREQIEINSIPVCVTVVDEGAAGSTYRTYHYSTLLEDETVFDVAMTIRYPTSVRIYADCEEDADQKTKYCKDLAFDDVRDTTLFSEIINTLQIE